MKNHNKETLRHKIDIKIIYINHTYVSLNHLLKTIFHPLRNTNVKITAQ